MARFKNDDVLILDENNFFKVEREAFFIPSGLIWGMTGFEPPTHHLEDPSVVAALGSGLALAISFSIGVGMGKSESEWIWESSPTLLLWNKKLEAIALQLHRLMYYNDK